MAWQSHARACAPVLLAGCVLAGAGGPAWAEQATRPRLELSAPGATAEDLSPAMDLLAGASDVPIEVVASPEWAARFVPLSAFTPASDDGSCWVRLRLGIAASDRQTWLLAVSHWALWGYSVSMHWQEEHRWNLQTVHQWTPMAERPFHDASALFDLQFLRREPTDIYLRFQQVVAHDLSLSQPGLIRAYTGAQYNLEKSTNWLFHGVLLGIFLIMALYNYVLYRSVLDRSYAWFAVTLIGYTLYFLGHEGIGAELLWTDAPWIVAGRFVAPLGASLIALGSVRFVLHYLQLSRARSLPILGLNLGVAVMFLELIRHIVTRILGGYINYIPFNLAAGFTVICAVIVIVGRARRGERPALLLLAATGLTALGTLVQILLLFSVVPRGFLSLHAMQIGIALQVAVLAIGLADRMRQIRTALAEREKSERLLHAMLPAPIAERLKAGESPIADRFVEVTVLFADIAGFTPLSAELAPERLVQTLNTIFSRFDALTSERNLEKIKTIGDCYMVVGGLPSPRPDHVEAVADLALALRAALTPTSDDPGSVDQLHIRMRIGIHCGSAVAGVIGTHKPAYDLWGDTVNTASRMESHGEPDHIHCSEAVYLKLKDQFAFSERGELEIRGKGLMRTYYLLGRRGA